LPFCEHIYSTIVRVWQGILNLWHGQPGIKNKDTEETVQNHQETIAPWINQSRFKLSHSRQQPQYRPFSQHNEFTGGRSSSHDLIEQTRTKNLASIHEVDKNSLVWLLISANYTSCRFRRRQQSNAGPSHHKSTRRFPRSIRYHPTNEVARNVHSAVMVREGTRILILLLQRELRILNSNFFPLFPDSPSLDG